MYSFQEQNHYVIQGLPVVPLDLELGNYPGQVTVV